MGDKLARRQAEQLMLQEPLSNESRIVIALAKLATMRGGEYSQVTLETFATGLSTEPFEDVLSTIAAVAASPRRAHEVACPDFGTLLLAVRTLRHPLRRLREIVGTLAHIFGETVSEEFLAPYEQEAGHRTDEDLERAYAALRGDETLRKMPTPAMFRAACGIPRFYRDGKRAG